MKRLLLLLILTLTLATADERTINKGTVYEATLFAKNETLFLKQQGKIVKLLALEQESSVEDEPSIYEDTIEYKIEDINFDKIDDILVRTMVGYGGVNVFYDLYLSENGTYKRSDISLSNYEIGANNTILAEYKDGPRHFTDIYKVNDAHDIVYFAKYEKYNSQDDLCFIKEINKDALRLNPISNKVVSCNALLTQGEFKALFAKVKTKKALLYTHDNDEKSNGMYLIKDDMVELIDGMAESKMVLVRFKGKRVVTKYVKRDELEVVPEKRYENRHTIFMYDEGKWNEFNASDTLILNAIGNKKYMFHFETIGKNAHSCTEEGVLEDKGKFLLYKENNECELKFVKISNGFTTEDKDRKCKDTACGVHAFLDGVELEEVKR